jgi:Protein of unknown function (DUF3551)
MRQIIALAAVLSAFALAAPAASAAGSGKFCLKGPGSTMQCSYQTMASCEKAKKGTQTCAANPASTTGSGSMSPSGSSSTSPSGSK